MYGGRIIESGPARAIFEHPAHPYTEGLMASVPRLDSTAKSHLFAIEGNPPDLAALPAGCAFAPRCPARFAACQTTRPDSFRWRPIITRRASRMPPDPILRVEDLQGTFPDHDGRPAAHAKSPACARSMASR